MVYRKRVAFWVVLDSIIVLSAVYLSYLCLYPNVYIFDRPELLLCSITLLVSHHFFASIYKLYNKVWQYASVQELVVIAKVVTLSIIVTSLVSYMVLHDIYVRALTLTWMLHLLFIGGSRFSWRILRDRYIGTPVEKKNTLIVGAGSAGTMVVRQLFNNREAELLPVAFIDDDPNKYKLQIMGIPVVGNSSHIPEMVEKYEIENIVLAIPSLSKKEMKIIYDECSKTKAQTQIMPMIEDIMLGKVAVNQFRKVEVEDLLGREPVKLDIEGISEYIKGKTVLVTGAGGSIGSEICRQICRFEPSKLVLLGHGENSIYQINMELKDQSKNGIEIVPVIADVQDRERMFEVLEIHRPDVVYHAAAHKHVPMMEYNPKEAVKNNVFGTKNTAEAAASVGVKKFVLVSTDKAVNPTNIMGATKRVAEMMIQQLDKESDTTFVAVRFGNVLGSRGSVIPLFKKQIEAGGPVTVTHPEMTRYFMTIPEASRLVIQAGSLAGGGEIFVLDMGEPVKIVDLAKNLIHLSGYSDIVDIEYTGLRPGEKMFEELLNENEVHREQIFPKIHIGKAGTVDGEILWRFVGSLRDKDGDVLKKQLIEIANTKDGLQAVMQEAASY